jgi:hypothetical protein
LSLALSPRPGDATSPNPSSAPTIDQGWPGDETELLTTLIQYFEEAESSSMDPRAMSEMCRDYYDGRQYTAPELATLRRRHQPPSVNNYVKRKVQLLLGMERRGRSDPKAFPRTPNEETRADVATQVLRYICDDQRFDVVRSSAFDNMMIEGTGAAEVIVKENEVDGGYDVVVNHIPWNRLFWDPHSAHPGFSDASYLGCVSWLDRNDAIDMYPGCEDILDSTFSSSRSDTYDDKPHTTWSDIARRRVRAVQIHWKRRQDWWTATFTKGGFLEAAMKSPYLDRHGHAMCPLIMRSIFIDRDLQRYSPVKDMISPQDSVNKRESKLLHLLNVNQLVFEQGAVDNEDHARDEAAKPDGVIVKNKGFDLEIRKDQAEVEGHFKMLQYAVEQMNVTGPNAAMAGKDPREQSGRAIIAQQSGGQVEHEPAADSLRQWSHKIYESMWMRARQFWTEEKSIRVTDDNKDVQFITLNRKVTLQEELSAMQPQQAQQIAQQMQLRPGDPRLGMTVRIEHALDDLDVDITVEEGPDSPTMQAEQFGQIMALPPMVLQNFPPEFFIKASSLRNKDDLVKMLEAHQQQQAATQQTAQQAAQAMQAAQVAKVQADAKDRNAQALERLHGIAVDHAGQPGADALADAQVAATRAGTLGRMHDMAMDHAAAQQPPDNGLLTPPPQGPPDPLAVQAQAHAQAIERTKLGLAAQAQAHDQRMDVAGHGLAVQQANQPPTPAPGP